MKTRIILLGSLWLCAVVSARVMTWPSYDFSKPPSLPLPAAYERAMKAMGQATNHYHCVSAGVTTMYFKDGEWDFTFVAATPTNGMSRTKFVAVYFDGTVKLDVPGAD